MNMQFTTIGNKNAPAVLLIHGMLSCGEDPLIFGRYLAAEYYVISPTLDGHGNDGSELDSAQDEAAKITAYLKENGITTLSLLQGSSMGAEVALAVREECGRCGISVGHCVFDGGPFFDFTPVKRFFMTLVFKRLIKLLDGDPDVVYERLRKNRFVKFIARDKLEDFRPVLTSIAKKRRKFTDRTVRGMVKTCYNCILPRFTKEEQRSFLFFFSVDEPARQSAPRLKKAYPFASYRCIRGYAHCGLQFKKPRRYAEFLKSIISGKQSSDRTQINQLMQQDRTCRTYTADR